MFKNQNLTELGWFRVTSLNFKILERLHCLNSPNIESGSEKTDVEN